MPDSSTNTDKQSNPSIPLRFSQLSIAGGDWPCAADKLGRSQEIENLTPVLLNAEAPLVLAIDAPWGGGKTTFIKLWQHYLTTEGKVSLYLNAWESDFADDPLLPMLAVLDDWFAKLDPKSTAGQLWKKTKELGPSLLKTSITAGVKLATLRALDAEAAIEKAVSEAAGGVAGDIVDSFKTKQSALAQFKVLLAKLLDELPEEQQNLIIFVDELDRCKPTYAIEVLERIKHLFDIDRLVFVLAVNRDQLSKSIQGVYGPSFDGLNYLKRFIDLDYHLQIPDQNAYIRMRLQQPDLRSYFAKRKDGRDEIHTVESVLFWLCARFDYTLRDIDQLITRWRLIVRSIPCNHYLDTVVLLSMLMLRQEKNALYQRFVQDVMSTNEVIEFLLGGDVRTTPFPESFGFIAGRLINSGYDEYQTTHFKQLITYWEQLSGDFPDDDRKQGELAGLVQIAKHRDFRRHYSGLRRAAFDRIELVSQIDISD